MPSAFNAAAGLVISSALKAGSRHALAMILPNALSCSGMVDPLGSRYEIRILITGGYLSF